jgi:hypothetical protein
VPRAVTPTLFFLNDNEGLSHALAVLAGVQEQFRPRHPLWQPLGLLVHERATNCARHIRQHREDYTQEFTLAALEFIAHRLDQLRRCTSPWGLLVSIGDRAGKHAVARYETGGLTGIPRSGASRPVVFSLDLERDEHGVDERSAGQDRPW